MLCYTVVSLCMVSSLPNSKILVITHIDTSKPVQHTLPVAPAGDHFPICKAHDSHRPVAEFL
jgi:hypothetical protein